MQAFNIQKTCWGGGVAQWLGRRISDQGVPGSNPGPAGAHFVVALSKSH